VSPTRGGIAIKKRGDFAKGDAGFAARSEGALAAEVHFPIAPDGDEVGIYRSPGFLQYGYKYNSANGLIIKLDRRRMPLPYPLSFEQMPAFCGCNMASMLALRYANHLFKTAFS
jgi:hypothetical protein